MIFFPASLSAAEVLGEKASAYTRITGSVPEGRRPSQLPSFMMNLMPSVWSMRQTEVPPTHRLITQPMHAQQVVWSRLGPAPLRWLERWRKDAFPSQLLALNARPSRGLWPETLGFKSQAIAIQGPLPKPAGPLTLLYVGGNDTIEKLLLALRERARQDGVDLRLQPLEEGLLMARLQKGDFQLACATAIFDPHPWAVLE